MSVDLLQPEVEYRSIVGAPKHYVLVRKDLPLVTQVVQIAHACRLAGAHFGVPEYAHVVLLHVKGPDELNRVTEILQETETNHVRMFEPDGDLGPTAICTQALPDTHKHLFKRFSMWKPTP